MQMESNNEAFGAPASMPAAAAPAPTATPPPPMPPQQPVPPETTSHAKAIATMAVVLIIAIGIIAYAAYTSGFAFLPPKVATTSTVSGPTTVAPTNSTPQAIALNASVVLYGIPNASNYVNVANNTGTFSNSTYKYVVYTDNYALGFALPIVAPTYIVPLNVSISIPSAYKNYTAPISLQLNVFVFRNNSSAKSFYLNVELPLYASMSASQYVNPYGTPVPANSPGAFHLTITFTQSNTSTYDSMTFTSGPLYNSSIGATRIVLYRNFIIFISSLGINKHYNITNLYSITSNMLNKLGG